MRYPEDVNQDGTVDVGDLLFLMSNWGAAGPTDIDGSGSTDVADLLALMAAWGSC